MARIFITGDKHGDFSDLAAQLTQAETTKDDLVVILGDHGTLYYEDHGIDRKKKALASMSATFICIRGNHDHRPTCEAYQHKFIEVDLPAYAGQFYFDEKYPNVLYTKEFGWYRFGSKRVFVIGGAFSVDKYKRVDMQKLGFTSYLWFSDEQLYPRERDAAQCELALKADDEFYVMSHTCPVKYTPYDKLMPGIDQSIVDKTMEWWLNEVEDGLRYTKWYCGHWHIDRSIDRMRFMYDDLELFDEIEAAQFESEKLNKGETHESISQ